MRVLVVEDDRELAEIVAKGLRNVQWAVDVANDGQAALDRLHDGDYDVVVLDRDLPQVHGDDVCAHVVHSGARTRVLMLTASGSALDMVEGLDIGADDYLAKPLDFPVLVARLRALARRAQPPVPPVLTWNDIVLDTARQSVSRAGRTIDLRPKEFGVLELLLAAAGRTVSAEELLHRVWDENADPFTSAVKITVSRLRTKLGLPDPIQTVAKAGYQIPPAVTP